MVKKIDVILTKNHSNGEKKGNIINVSSGYAFNYLIPNQIAEIATEKKIKHIKMFEEIEKKQKVANEVEVNLVKEKIEKIQKISIYKKVGENSIIFGSITEKDISRWLTKYTDIKINKKQIKMPDTKNIGITYMEIQIKQKIVSKILIQIIPTNI
uniref:Large ribosomal subunit protein bL9c n=1 Tax=Rhodomela confervoides TaxID=35163 RepID=A0A1Z1M9X0_RHOCN|nr:ribosomal protein L9 [Rhodomela confervoides]ARW62776.1 ribosomal protein L9 [Rhodomela confervoides]